VGRELPGGSGITAGSRGLVRLAAGAVPPGGRCCERNLKALCAWRYATLARQSGSCQRLAVRVTCQAIYAAVALNFGCEFCDLQDV